MPQRESKLESLENRRILPNIKMETNAILLIFVTEKDMPIDEPLKNNTKKCEKILPTVKYRGNEYNTQKLVV